MYSNQRYDGGSSFSSQNLSPGLTNVPRYSDPPMGSRRSGNSGNPVATQNGTPEGMPRLGGAPRQPAGVSGPSAGGSLSHDEFDYKTHVLYVMPGNDASIKAQKMAAQAHNIQVVNLWTIHPSKRPTWLVGAPTLINIQTQQVSMGSQALRQIEEISGSMMNGADCRTGIGYDFNTHHSTTMTCSSGCEIDPILDDERKYSNSNPKITDTDINKLIASRGGGDSTVPTTNTVHP